MPLRRAIMLAIIAFFAALGGVVTGRLVIPHTQPESGLHDVLHQELEFDPGQTVRLRQIERRFALRRTASKLKLRAANARLADAIETEHGNGPRVATAVNASHVTMGELQKEALVHIFEMRQLLRPDQMATFDRAVTRALINDTR
ncbi:heavy metal resistance protein [Sphingomonas koreensis]|uniref:periplasmic heavy metal sensor n=1 Tax=Sphingomonas koreensis TaxID=93064 RepID=UPI0008369191|nr:periplasmic heavy metal sensor [Sphingomonas koreensis]PJI87227.1 heavy-metal resistance protein [Sphingomonas koreensis]RSU59562.1 heavy metal resistance protein [Sphingomonas koreensis]RSU68715.1 heavy metal resistance protein [Sphingomonas koreensis]